MHDRAAYIRHPDLDWMSCHCVLQLGWFLGSKTRCSDAVGDQKFRRAHSPCRRKLNAMQTHGPWCCHLPIFPSKFLASWSETVHTVSPHHHPLTGVHYTCIRQASTVIWRLPACCPIQGPNNFYCKWLHKTCIRLVFLLTRAHNMRITTVHIKWYFCIIQSNQTCCFI